MGHWRPTIEEIAIAITRECELGESSRWHASTRARVTDEATVAATIGTLSSRVGIVEVAVSASL